MGQQDRAEGGCDSARAFWWTMSYEKPPSHDKRLLWGLKRLSLTPTVRNGGLGKTTAPLNFIPTYCGSKHLDPLTTSKGNGEDN